MKNTPDEFIYFRTYVCAVFAAEYTEAVTAVHSHPVKPGKYAVFVRPDGADRFVQVSKWYSYKGSAVSKMYRMFTR